jgi:hypothetical protein
MAMYNQRVAYTDNEIAKLINNKMKELKHTKEELFNMYKDNFISEYPYFSIKTIEYMLDGITRYDVLMTEVATETPKPKGMGFLGII